MRFLFADTFYWIALLNPRDENHQRVKNFNRSLDNYRIVTTDEVLTDVFDLRDRTDL
ncbi:hypothetical protein [Gloeocapsa sp. PCC 73106]|uniref:hypothetical protein n=1 Tax=Gloeocapsa sp. PCC 73106 TaxID=102232 RepID=UPI0002ACD759|nr:hypothetical protein [Gloeocapsa sp. PCC 73106]ELR99503.1 hypothetical protein GLO73106DRAFT_00033550 [Gloeocapsa sp. PCC 73106]